MSCSIEASHLALRGIWKWGTYGKEGTQPMRKVLLKDLSDNHLRAILNTQDHLTEGVVKLFEQEVFYRSEQGIEVGEQEQTNGMDAVWKLAKEQD